MKKMDVFVIYLIASFMALNNAYMTFGTGYKFMYIAWVVVAVSCVGVGLVKLFKK